MRRISLLFSITLFLFSFVILFSCSSGGGSDPAPDPQAQVANFTFTKGDVYIFQETDGVNKNLISRIYYNGESWKRAVVLKDLPFVIYDMAVDTKNNWLYIVASDKVIYRIKPITGGKPEKILDNPNFALTSRITINNTDEELYFKYDKQILSCDLDGKNVKVLANLNESCVDLDFDNVKKYLYYISNQDGIYYHQIGTFNNTKVLGTQVAKEVQVYPGNTFPGNGLYLTVAGNIYRCDKNNGNGLQVMANNFDFDSQLILNAEKNLLLYFKSGEMYSLDIITSAVSATGLKPGGFVRCGVAVK